MASTKPILTRERMQAIALKLGFKAKDAKAWYDKWRGVVRNARCREIECTITFTRYLKMAAEADLTKPSQIGMGVKQYNLARNGDTGGYVKGNCRFITSKQNRRERVINGCFDRMAFEMRGETKNTSERFAKLSATIAGRNRHNHEGIARKALKQSKRFRLKAPDGTIYKGRNLNQFCKDHGLNMGAMSGVCVGRLNHHKHWTGKYLKEAKK